MTFENKNEKQVYFNQVKGCIKEISQGEFFTNVVVVVGHENQRDVNFVVKTNEYKSKYSEFNVNDKVAMKYYLTSRNKNNRWYTNANILDIAKD
jgi:hypothetical protein